MYWFYGTCSRGSRSHLIAKAHYENEINTENSNTVSLYVSIFYAHYLFFPITKTIIESSGSMIVRKHREWEKNTENHNAVHVNINFMLLHISTSKDHITDLKQHGNIFAYGLIVQKHAMFKNTHWKYSVDPHSALCVNVNEK